MDPYNPEHIAIIRNPDFKNDRQKIGEFVSRSLVEVLTKDPRKLRYQFDGLLNKLASPDSDESLQGSNLPFDNLLPAIDFGDGISLQFFVYNPNDEKHHPSILAEWLDTPKSATKSGPPPTLFKEYVARDMFEEGSPRFNPQAGAILELLKMSAATRESGLREEQEPQGLSPRSNLHKFFNSISKVIRGE
jgi:hypothetical protein